jgi:hypothetical protein
VSGGEQKIGLDVTLETLLEGEDELEGLSVFHDLYTLPWSHKIGLWIVKRLNFWKLLHGSVLMYLFSSI